MIKYDDLFSNTGMHNFFFQSSDSKLFNSKNTSLDYNVDETGINIELEVPGFCKNEISVNIEKGLSWDSDKLAISAKNDRKSITETLFFKSNTFDYDSYEISLELGVLKIEIPKLKTQNDRKKIELKF